MNEMYQSSPEVEEAEEVEKTRDALGLLETEVNSAETKEASKSNKEFGGVPLSYNGRYTVPGIDQTTIKPNKYKKFPGVQFSDCRLDIKPNRGERMGTVICKGNHKESYYSMAKLPGGRLEIPGRHVARDGTIRDKDGYICVAANYISKGSTIMTTLGPGKVYDTGGMTGKWIDIYTYWSDNQHWDEKRDWERCQKLCEEQVKKFEKRKEK